MNRGKLIDSWSEPDAWRQAALAHAKQESESVSSLPWLRCIAALGLVSAPIIWEWSDANPNTRASIPELILIISVLIGFFVGLAWMQVRLNRIKKTFIYQRGLVHGSFIKKRWIPWKEIEYFYVDEDSVGLHSFRFLNWLRQDAEDEEFSVVPENVDMSALVSCLENNHVKQVGGAELPR